MEVSTSLTTTGLIATLVSVLFAIAALYVSHRKRNQASATHANAPSQVTSIFTPGAHTRAAPAHIPMSSPGHPIESDTTPRPSALSAAPPLFNKLSPKGVEKPSRTPYDRENEYVWE